MTNIFLYPQLSTRSKRAIARVHTKFSHPYDYRPRGTLLERLARNNQMTIDQVYRQLIDERRQILRESGIREP
jgi:hypothetical protein